MWVHLIYLTCLFFFLFDGQLKATSHNLNEFLLAIYISRYTISKLRLSMRVFISWISEDQGKIDLAIPDIFPAFQCQEIIGWTILSSWLHEQKAALGTCLHGLFITWFQGTAIIWSITFPLTLIYLALFIKKKKQIRPWNLISSKGTEIQKNIKKEK